MRRATGRVEYESLPGATGAPLSPWGICPGCGKPSHVGLTCRGRTSEEAARYLANLASSLRIPHRRV